MTAALKREGWKINHKPVLRIMREEGLLCRPRRGFVRTTDSKHGYPVYPNLVKGLQPEAPNVVWVAAITYIRLPRGFVYLATILDSYARKCIGEALQTHRCTTRPGSLGAGFSHTGGATRADPSLGSRRAICQPGVCSTTE